MHTLCGKHDINKANKRNFTGLAFRGDGAENFRSIDFDFEKNYFRSNPNEGNFIGIVKLMAGENLDLSEHIKKCQEYEKTTGRQNRLTFLSNNFVSRCLSTIRIFLLRTIVNEIHESGDKFGLSE